MSNNRYEDCVKYMQAQLPMYHRVGAAAYKTDITNTVLLCEHFGNPQNQLRCIHIAGTNGKTSSSHFMASILQKAGYKVGLYTSPHLIDFRERIIVDGKMIDKDYVADFVESNKAVFEKLQPSFFEMTFVLAVKYFVDMKVDYAVIEVGLGGRLDSTNVITPLVSMITNIGFDHTQFLGNTLPAIAFEKAGIIKKNVPAVIGETQPETTMVYVKKAFQEDAPLIFADQVFQISDVVQTMDKLSFRAVSGLTDEVYDVESALVGHYEIKNITSVLATVEVLSKQVFIPKQAVLDGLKSSILRGRWDIIGRNPLIVCDTGHNAEGLAETLEMISFAKYRRLHIIFGAVSDKKMDKTINLFPKDATYYFCRPDIPRGMNVDVLMEWFAKAGISGTAYESCMEALQAAKAASSPDDLIYVGGSTFVVADILSSLH